MAKTENATEKAKSNKLLDDFHSKFNQLERSYNALKKESDGTKYDIDTYQRQCTDAKEEAKLCCATTKEVNFKSAI